MHIPIANLVSSANSGPIILLPPVVLQPNVSLRYVICEYLISKLIIGMPAVPFVLFGCLLYVFHGYRFTRSLSGFFLAFFIGLLHPSVI